MEEKLLIKEIFECTRCNLSGVENRDREYYGGDGKKKIMLVFQNPGVPSELRQRKSTLEEEVNECREGFHRYWVLGKHKETFERFFKIFDRYGLIKMDKNYIKDKTYFKDLYITDVVKCHGRTKEIKGKQPCYAWLKDEIKLKAPSLIIAFSDKTLSFFNQFDIRPVNHNEQLRPQAAKLHGRLYKCDSFMDFYLIPSIHISVDYFSPRDSYLKYFKEGIRNFVKFGTSSRNK